MHESKTTGVPGDEATTDAELASWIASGRKRGASYLILVMDMFDGSCSPRYVMPGESLDAAKLKALRQDFDEIADVYELITGHVLTDMGGMVNDTDVPLADALSYAAIAHRAQTRKGTAIPYISHLMAVAAIVLEAGGSEREAVAAVLHDVVEDQELDPGGGRARLDDVRSRFGPEVASIVESLSDWISERYGEDKSETSYVVRKERYQRHLAAEKNPSVLLVSAADKLHNARSMVADLNRHGEALWKRFNGSKADIIWNFDRLLSIYREGVGDRRRDLVVEELQKAVDVLKARS